MKIKFCNANIITVNDNFDVIFGDVVVHDNIIKYVGKKLSNKHELSLEIDKVIDCKNNILMPGLINTHSHAAMTLFRGMADGVLFQEWWEKNMLPLEAKLTKADIARGAEIAFREMLSNGITSVFDCYFNAEQTVKVANNLNIRLGVAFGAISPKDVVTQKSLQSEFDFLAKQKNVIPFLYAHSTYSCDEQQFAEILKFAKKNNLVFSTHISETLLEVGEVHNKYGVTPVGLLESYGMFDVPCVLAHCVHCDKDDIAIMKKYNVTVSHNPGSNLKLGSGIAPVYSYLKNNINVCLGTDGAASNNNLDILKEMNLAGNLQFGIMHNPSLISAAQLIKMATVNGAKAFNISNLGAIKEGYLADIILIDNNLPNMQPQNNLISNLVFSATNKNILLTMVNGEIAYNKYKS